MVTINPESKDQPLPDELVLLKLSAIFGDDLHIKPETKQCSVCSKDLPVGRFKRDRRSNDSGVCLRCAHNSVIARNF